MRRRSKNLKLERSCGVVRFLIYVLPLALFFSYHPVISLGVGESMNFELSVPLIWLVMFDAVGVVVLIREGIFGKIAKKWKWWWLAFVAAPGFVTVSLLWSMNLVRGVLTCGVMWLILIACGVMVGLRGWFSAEEFRRKFCRWFFGAALFACAWCVIQCVLDVAGVSREYSLMCLGCISYSFGFPHPNGFAIEPQFMGNLLLAPAVVAAWLYTKKQNSRKLGLERSRGDNFYNGSVGAHTKLQFRDSLRDRCKNYAGSCSLGPNFLLFCFFIITFTLFLTLSRGAIYAFVMGLVFMSAFVVVKWKKKWRLVMKSVGIVWGMAVLGFLCALNAQGIMAQVGPTNDTYIDGVAKVLNQLSLGIIDIRGKGEVVDNMSGEGVKEAQSVSVSEETTGEGSVDVGDADVAVVEKPVENSEDEAKVEAVFDGYVAESTNVRMELNRNALAVWARDFKTMMLGVGIGGAGEAMYQAGLTGSPKEIVQNEYVSLLLEVGVVGVSLLVLMLVMVVRVVLKSGGAGVGMVLTLMVAYGVSLLFFSGFANALQIYLLPMVLLGVGKSF